MTPRSEFPLIEWHDCLDSTNNEAKRNLSRFANLSVLSAVCQTSGRGRGSHTWLSQAGQNLTFSLILKPKEGFLLSNEAVRLTHLATVALCFYLEELGLKPRIKWPNDIWVGDKKICGILIENSFTGGSLSSSIIGVGLNLNQKEFDPLLPNPSSLALLTGKHFEPAVVLDSFYKIFCHLYSKLKSEGGKNEVELEFSRRMFVLEKPFQDALSASIEGFEAAK